MSAQRFVLPSGTVTFLLTDIEGSTRHWEDDASTMAPAVARHYDILDDVIGRWGGVRPVEQGEGDSVVAAFPRATDGLGAAVEAQQKLMAELGDVFAVRMALHTGEAQLRDEGNYFGETVNRCARVRACGHGGQVLCTQSVVELVGEKLPVDVHLVDLGSTACATSADPSECGRSRSPACRRGSHRCARSTPSITTSPSR